MRKKLWRALIKKLTYLFITLVVILAVIMVATRLLTPVLEEHRPDIEKWASEVLDTSIVIDKVRLSWYRYQPEVSLLHVTVLGKENKQPVLQVEKVSVSFSILRSLWQWKIVPSGVLVSGAEINIHENNKNEYSIQGFPILHGFSDQPFQNETKASDVVTWLLSQSRLSLRNIDVHYTGLTNQVRYVTLYKLTLDNGSRDHRLTGKAILHQDIPTEVTLGAEWQGNEIDIAKIKAKVYVYVSGLSMLQWFQGFSWQGWHINKGIISAKVWADWQAGAFQKVQTEFQAYDVSLYSQTNKSTHYLNRLSGNVGWRHEDNKYIFAGEDILLDLPNHLWPVTSFYVELQPDATGAWMPKVANVGYLDLADLQTFLFASSLSISPTLQAILDGIQLRGGLQNIAITFATPWTDWQHASASLVFTNLNLAPWHTYPGIKHLSGKAKWNNALGEMTLNTNRAQFDDSAVFANPIQIDQMTGTINWQLKNDNWILMIPSLQLLNTDAAANISGSVTLPPDLSPLVDVHGNFTLRQVSHIAHYLPLKVFSTDLVQWLKEAFLAGEADSGHLELRGKLADFPFDGQNGTFVISTNVKDVTLSYAKEWPMLEHINGVLTFAGHGMTVDVTKGTTLGVPITNVHGEIPYFGEDHDSVLQVNADNIATDFAQGLNYVHHSPLEASIGKMFHDVDIHGPMNLKLGLTIPLSKPDNTQVLGDIKMKNVTMDMVPWKLRVTKLNGLVHFTESTTSAENIQAELFNKPLSFSLTSIEAVKQPTIVRASFASQLAITDLENWLQIPFGKVVQGNTAVKGEIDFSLTAPMQVRLASDLVGVAVNLPDEYGKKPPESRKFSATITAQENQPLRMRLQYDTLFGAALILNKKNDVFDLVGANLQFGEGEISWPAASGLYLSGRFDNLDWDKIKHYSEQTSTTAMPDTFSHLPLKEINIDVNTINLAGLTIPQVHLQITPDTDEWNIDITSPTVVGQLDIPKNMTRQSTISAQFQKLNLNVPNDSKQKSVIAVETLPAIEFSAAQVGYNGLPLGQVTFNARPRQRGLTIQTLRIVSRRMDLQATGSWIAINHDDMTELQGSVSSDNVSELLNNFKLDAHNFVSSKGRVNFNLNWGAAPYAPTLASMSGTVSLELGKGRIVDIGKDNGAKMDLGRMLSIFSLQTIPRRLSLDFSDVFQKGYSFDYIRGDFTLHNGNAFTKNLRFDGPVARVGIDGQIGLKNKSVNFVLIVTPYVTSSIPVAATLITGQPLVGLAAFAVNSVIGSQVSKATTYYYTVNGSWDNPSWQSAGQNQVKH